MPIDTPIPVGNPMKVLVTFTDDNNSLFDPDDSIQIVVQNPNGTSNTYAYPSQLSKQGVGKYYVVVEATIKGYWSGQGSGNIGGLAVTTTKVYKKVS